MRSGLGLGAAAGKIVSNPVIQQAVENEVEGAVTGAGEYCAGPGPHTDPGALEAAAVGGATGAAPFGGLSAKPESQVK